MDGARSPAPDLFAALAWGNRLAPEPVEAPPVNPDRPTAPELPVIGGPSPLARPAAVVVAASRPLPPVDAPPPSSPASGFTPLADLLEPDADGDPIPGPRPSDPVREEEFEGLLDVFDDSGDVPITDASPPPRAPVGLRRPTPVMFPRPRGGAVPLVRAPSAPAPVAVPRTSGVPSFPAPGDAAESGQLHAAAHSGTALVSRVAPLVDDMPDDVPARGSGATWVWVTLSLMLAGALAWVLYTQTDLFSGDVIGNRDRAVQAEVEAEVAAHDAAIAKAQAEYGSIQIDSTPQGARVFDVRPGPEARFDALPIAHEYMILVTAPGHQPRVRILKGSELAAPVIVDLDPLPAGAVTPPVPEERPPRLADQPGDVHEALVLKSNTPGARLALLVGYTPGVRLIDVDVEQPRTLWVALAGHELAELVVKGRHYEDDADGNPVYAEHVTLQPADEVEPPAPTPVVDASVPPPPAEAAAAAPEPTPKSTKKKKKKKKKRRR